MNRNQDQGQGNTNDVPFPGLSALREVTPPAALVPAVMRTISEPVVVSFWDWLRRPLRLELRLSPMGAAACLGLTVAGAWLAVLKPPAEQAAMPTAVLTEAAEEAVLVRFVLVANGAKKVAVVGDFNGWDPQHSLLEDADGKGTFAVTLRVPKGPHEYMFWVDGKWVTDPGASERRPDGFGRTNAILRL